MERRSLFCRDIIKGFALLTDVFFLLLEHVEIMQIIVNCNLMNSQAKMRTVWFDGDELIAILLVIQYVCWIHLNAKFFVIASLSHISIELSGTDMQDSLELTSAHTCTHMYKHTQADIHAHAAHVGAQTLKCKTKARQEGKKERKRVCSTWLSLGERECEREREGGRGDCVCF